MTKQEFNASVSGTSRALAKGHQARTGHELVGHYKHIGKGVYTLVKTCCGEKDSDG